MKIRTWSGSYVEIDRPHLALAGWARFLIQGTEHYLGNFASLLAFVLAYVVAMFTIDLGAWPYLEGVALLLGSGLVGWTAWQVLLAWADS